jgi:hypothetical protein
MLEKIGVPAAGGVAWQDASVLTSMALPSGREI